MWLLSLFWKAPGWLLTQLPIATLTRRPFLRVMYSAERVQWIRETLFSDLGLSSCKINLQSLLSKDFIPLYGNKPWHVAHATKYCPLWTLIFLAHRCQWRSTHNIFPVWALKWRAGSLKGLSIISNNSYSTLSMGRVWFCSSAPLKWTGMGCNTTLNQWTGVALFLEAAMFFSSTG